MVPPGNVGKYFWECDAILQAYYAVVNFSRKLWEFLTAL